MVSLITDEHRARIGVQSDPIPVRIREQDFRYVREVLEDRDPRYADGTGNAALYGMSILEPRPVGGLSANIVPKILPSGILTQTEWTTHRTLKVEEQLYARHQVVDIRERLGGRFGRSVIILVHSEYRDDAGELVAETAHTVTQFDPAQGSSNS